MSDTAARTPTDDPADNTIPPQFDPADEAGVLAPPTTLAGTLRQLGPGLIIAGSIVGSGELIATTKTGAQAGITLLWLIIIGCLIKVFVQIELGRISITHGETTLAILNKVPGRIGPVNWILWFWLAMMSASIAQLGGIVGGVGQALAISFPISGDYRAAIEMPSASQFAQYLQWDDALLSTYDLFLVDRLRQHPEDGVWSPAEGPAGELSRRSLAWLQSRVARTQALLDALPPAEQTALWQAFHDTLRAEAQSPAQLEAPRSALRQQLREINRQPLAAALEQRTQSGLAGLDAAQAERLQRGHEVLSEDLTAAARRRRFREVVQTLVGQLLAQEAAAAQAALPADAADARFAALEVQHARNRVQSLTEPKTWDDKYWAAVVTFVTIGLLWRGNYGVIQNLSTVLVVMFTFLTVGNVLSLQTAPQWRLSAETIWHGLSFHLPESGAGLGMALATFGIIGVGATELITYPYWCIEKGYARYTGWRSDDPAWAVRARGWMRVMHWDAFISMIVYTVATVAFYLMGAAVLHGEGRDPDGMRMVGTLATAYVPVFGEYAWYLFLLGAFAVLYSTFLVANAGHARMFTDGLKLFGLLDKHSQRAHDRAITALCVALPLICLAIFWSGINPVTAVAFAGMMQATMLPMIGFGALYARWTSTDPRLAPPTWWDLLLWLSFVGLLVVGVYGVWSKLFS